MEVILSGVLLGIMLLGFIISGSTEFGANYQSFVLQGKELIAFNTQEKLPKIVCPQNTVCNTDNWRSDSFFLYLKWGENLQFSPGLIMVNRQPVGILGDLDLIATPTTIGLDEDYLFDVAMPFFGVGLTGGYLNQQFAYGAKAEAGVNFRLGRLNLRPAIGYRFLQDLNTTVSTSSINLGFQLGYTWK